MIEVGLAPGRGRGVYATQSIKRSTVIERAPVIVIPGEQWRTLEQTDMFHYYFAWGEKLEAGAVALGYGSLYNHSFQPNAHFEYDVDNRFISYYALRDIAPGEEITINYNGEPDDQTRIWFPAAEGGVRRAAPKSKHRKALPTGPVARLEQHLPTEWWKGYYTGLYLLIHGNVVENPENARADVDRILEAVPLKPDSRILDLCCGQGRHCLELASRGFTGVTGVDQSQDLLKIARARAKDLSLAVHFSLDDARKLDMPSGRFDCVVILGGSVGLFDTPAEDLAMLHEARRVLKPDGVLLVEANSPAPFEPRTWDWIDHELFVCRERQFTPDGRLVTRETLHRTSRGVAEDQLCSVRLFPEDQLHVLLRRAGFTSVAPWGPTDGERLRLMASKG